VAPVASDPSTTARFTSEIDCELLAAAPPVEPTLLDAAAFVESPAVLPLDASPCAERVPAAARSSAARSAPRLEVRARLAPLDALAAAAEAVAVLVWVAFVAEELPAASPDAPCEGADEALVVFPAAVAASPSAAVAGAVPEVEVAPGASAESSPSSEARAGKAGLAVAVAVAVAPVAPAAVGVPDPAAPAAAVSVAEVPVTAVPAAAVPDSAADAATVESPAEPPVLPCGVTGLPFISNGLEVDPAGTGIFVAAGGEALPLAGNWLPLFLPESLLRADFPDASCIAPAKFEDEAAGWAFSLAEGDCGLAGGVGGGGARRATMAVLMPRTKQGACQPAAI
jgi:hypothetical protein